MTSHENPSTSPASEDLREAAQHVAEDVRDLGRAAKEFAKEKVQETRQSGDALFEGGAEKVREIEDQVLEYVRANPLKSLLIALATGIVLGAITRR